MIRPTTLLFLFCLFLLLTGCGSGDEEAATATPKQATATPQQPTQQPTQKSATAAPEAADATLVPPTSTPLPADTAAIFVPAPEPIGTVVYYTTTVTLPTYPREQYEADAVDPETNWPYKTFDYERFRAEQPTPEPRDYLAVIVENVYLRMTILPQLGGRIWQVEHKASGNLMFYQNEVVKPSPWGPGEQLGWLALGGLEWNVPVVEHGYDWGVEWGYLPNQHSENLVTITLFTPPRGQSLSVSINISLRSGAASFEIEPTVANSSGETVAFDYWHDAMLAPGPSNAPSAKLRFVLPGERMTVHSTGDPALPTVGDLFSWPIHEERDLSQLGNWGQYLGFFEAPAAHGPFAGVYDAAYDAGAVRVYPADVARGSKVFGLGWNERLSSDNFTDDGSAYVELHGGLAPSFFERAELPAGGAVTWREVWYPVQEIGGLSAANELGALAIVRADETDEESGVEVGLYPTRPLQGTLVVALNGEDVHEQPVDLTPEEPFYAQLLDEGEVANNDEITVRFVDRGGRVLLHARGGQ